jgi:hypothetical protein
MTARKREGVCGINGVYQNLHLGHGPLLVLATTAAMVMAAEDSLRECGFLVA